MLAVPRAASAQSRRFPCSSPVHVFSATFLVAPANPMSANANELYAWLMQSRGVDNLVDILPVFAVKQDEGIFRGRTSVLCSVLIQACDVFRMIDVDMVHVCRMRIARRHESIIPEK